MARALYRLADGRRRLQGCCLPHGWVEGSGGAGRNRSSLAVPRLLLLLLPPQEEEDSGEEGEDDISGPARQPRCHPADTYHMFQVRLAR